MTGNYEEKLSQEIMRRNLVSQEIMRRNYYRKL